MWRKFKDSSFNIFRKRHYSEMEAENDEERSLYPVTPTSTSSATLTETSAIKDDTLGHSDVNYNYGGIESIPSQYEFYAARSNGLTAPISVRETVEQLIKGRWQRRYRKLEDPELEVSDEEEEDDLRNDELSGNCRNVEINIDVNGHNHLSACDESTDERCYHQGYDQSEVRNVARQRRNGARTADSAKEKVGKSRRPRRKKIAKLSRRGVRKSWKWLKIGFSGYAHMFSAGTNFFWSPNRH